MVKRQSDMSDGAGKNSLFLMRERGLYLGAGSYIQVHATHAVKVYVAAYGGLRLRAAGSTDWRSCHAVLIPPGVPHQIDARSALLGNFVLVPETEAARRMLGRYSTGEAQPLPTRAVEAVLPRLRKFYESGCESGQAVEVCDDLFQALTPARSRPPNLDSRVEGALEYIRYASDYRVPVAEVAGAVSLSAGRLSHLFREQTGTTLNHYLLWRRLRAALDEMAASRSLTEVAHRAGFADSAHLSRTFRRMFGQAPSELFRTSRVIRADM